MSTKFTRDTKPIVANAEFRRIKSLPYRGLDFDGDLAVYARELSYVLRTVYGSKELFPVQAWALHELINIGGAFVPAPVGAGKTLITLLAPQVTDCKRPLLLVPAHLKQKTENDRNESLQDWQVSTALKVSSYQYLGGPGEGRNLLAEYRPDLLILDECHYLKNTRAAVTRRVNRYLKANPHVQVVALSGTIAKRSLQDFAHIIRWCLKDKTPLPIDMIDLLNWCRAADVKVRDEERAAPGALMNLVPSIKCTADLDGARKQVFTRIFGTPGVVPPQEVDVAASIEIVQDATKWPALNTSVRDAFHDLRADWILPDGWELASPVDVWRVAQELALGFYYVWDPRPPSDWLDARKEWHKFCREVLRNSRTLDSEADVAKQHPTATAWLNWQAIRGEFIPRSVPVWIDTSIVDAAVKWVRKNHGIVWTDHVAFGEKMAEHGVVYYGSEGLSAAGQYIEKHPKKQGCCASIKANATGRNLQYLFSKNLLVSVISAGYTWEQLIGRTHRHGQDADTVWLDVIATCVEHLTAFEQALADARFLEKTGKQKILIADKVINYGKRSGPQWHKTVGMSAKQQQAMERLGL